MVVHRQSLVVPLHTRNKIVVVMLFLSIHKFQEKSVGGAAQETRHYVAFVSGIADLFLKTYGRIR